MDRMLLFMLTPRTQQHYDCLLLTLQYYIYYDDVKLLFPYNILNIKNMLDIAVAQ